MFAAQTLKRPNSSSQRPGIAPRLFGTVSPLSLTINLSDDSRHGLNEAEIEESPMSLGTIESGCEISRPDKADIVFMAQIFVSKFVMGSDEVEG